MELGPVDIIVIDFPGMAPDPRSVAAMRQLEASGLVRMMDALIIAKDHDGAVTFSECSTLDSMEDLATDLLARQMLGLLSAEDIAETGEQLDPGASALVLVVENVWARAAARTVRREGGQFTTMARIADDQMLEAVARISSGLTS
jgi:uncharacterized membrane protein